jgi:FkbM family methyltransferase
MLSKLVKKIKKLKFQKSHGTISYAQAGEDLIIDFIFRAMGVGLPTYLDIGAHAPIAISNTYFFYKAGARGVCIEADPELLEFFKKKRNKDICINCGVSDVDNGLSNFYLMSTSTLNTFSEEEAKKYVSYGAQRIKSVIQIPILGINSILNQYFKDTSPDIVSIDVEGLDFAIVSAIDFTKWRPKVFCIETLSYSENRTEVKNQEIIDFLKSKDYIVYGDTYINTIFVDRKSWVDEK